MGLLDVLRDLLTPSITEVAHPGGEVGCAIPWQPHALAPVFWGVHHIGPPVIAPVALATDSSDDGNSQAKHSVDQTADSAATAIIDPGGLHAGIFAPAPMRILFPTLDGSPQHAQILFRCGAYPLVVLLHGQCQAAQSTHYLAWANSPLAMQLARAGYVVVVPQLSGQAASDSEVELVRSVIDWVRKSWVHARLVASAPETAVIGHSRGSVLAGLVAAKEGVRAYVSLSGDWHGSFGDPTEAQQAIAAPMLFIKDEGEGDVDLGRFQDLPLPRYRSVLKGGGHYDYLMPASSPCAARPGDCTRTPSITADLVTMFLGRFAAAAEAEDLAAQIPDSLVRGLGPLTMQQEFYAGAYLHSFDGPSIPGCGFEMRFEVPGRIERTITF
jgi:hypothetical protein